MVAKLLLAQLAVTVVLGMIFWGIDGQVSGYSAFLGGLPCVMPTRSAAP